MDSQERTENEYSDANYKELYFSSMKHLSDIQNMANTALRTPEKAYLKQTEDKMVETISK